MATMVDFKGLHKNVIRVNEARQRVSNVIQQNAWNGNQSCDIQKAMSIVGATAYEQGRIRPGTCRCWFHSEWHYG